MSIFTRLMKAAAPLAVLLSGGAATAQSPAAGCIETLGKEASTLATSQISSYGTRDQTPRGRASTEISIACNPFAQIDITTISRCASVMRHHHEKFGGGDMLKWDRLRAQIGEFKNHGVCDGTHLTESLPKSTPVPPGTYPPKMEQHFKTMTSACSADLNDRPNAINCMKGTAQAALSLENEFTHRLGLAKQRSSDPTEQQRIQTGIDTAKANCQPLTKLTGTFETMLQPTLEQISACITDINHTGYGQKRDIVGIGHGDVTGVPDNLKSVTWAMKQIAGEVLKLNYLGQYKPGGPGR